MRTFQIARPDEVIRSVIQDKIDNLNKPKGSLGVLEELAMQVCLIQQTLTPSLAHPSHLLLGGDHGIEREGVSVSPREVTWQQMINFTRGGGGVNMFCRQHGFKLRIVDVGVDYDLSAVPVFRQILHRQFPGTVLLLRGNGQDHLPGFHSVSQNGKDHLIRPDAAGIIIVIPLLYDGDIHR